MVTLTTFQLFNKYSFQKKNANVVAFTASSSDWHRALRMIRIKKMLANMVEGTKAASVPVSNVQ